MGIAYRIKACSQLPVFGSEIRYLVGERVLDQMPGIAAEHRGEEGRSSRGGQSRRSEHSLHEVSPAYFHRCAELSRRRPRHAQASRCM